MIKNTAGQKIGVQMVSATDGSAFTGSVTVSVTGDAGTQATGSVGSGACTHEGNGYHTYAPAQAETNYTLIAFTFTGTGAVPATVQVFTTGFDPTAAVVPANTTQFAGSAITSAAGIPEVKVASVANDAITAAAIADNAIDAGAIASDAITAAKLHADVTTELQSGLATAAALAVVDGIVDDILVDTAEIGTAGAGLTNINLPNQTMDIVGNITGNLSGSVGSVTGLTASDVGAIKAKTDNLPSDPADASDIAASHASLASTLATIAGYLDTEIAAIKTVTDQFTAAQSEPSAVPAANASPLAKIAWLAALARNKVTQTATTQTLKADDGTTTIAAATVSDDGTTFTRGEFA